MNTEKLIRQLHSFLSLSAENIEPYYSTQLQGRQWIAVFTISNANNSLCKDFVYDIEVRVNLSDTNIENITVIPASENVKYEFYAFCRSVWHHLHYTWKNNLYWVQTYYKNTQYLDTTKFETCVFNAYPKNYKNVEGNK